MAQLQSEVPPRREQAAQAAFRGLADPTRRAILRHLSAADLTIAEVADRFDMTRAAVRKHLQVLEEGDLIVVQAVGRERINQINPAGLRLAHDWLSYFDQFWDTRLARLRDAAQKAQKTQKTQKQSRGRQKI